MAVPTAPDLEPVIQGLWAIRRERFAATYDVTPQSEIVYGIYEATTPGGENFGSPLAFTPLICDGTGWR